jgi:hypothetical protein
MSKNTVSIGEFFALTAMNRISGALEKSRVLKQVQSLLAMYVLKIFLCRKNVHLIPVFVFTKILETREAIEDNEEIIICNTFPILLPCNLHI